MVARMRTMRLSRNDAAPGRVGHDAGGDLEHHHSGREEGVGNEHLEDGEPGVEQEQRVDAPDE